MRHDTRKQVMGRVRELSKSADMRGDVAMRRQHATIWCELATAAEARRAPMYLTWIGR